jgi:hypothetical protein
MYSEIVDLPFEIFTMNTIRPLFSFDQHKVSSADGFSPDSHFVKTVRSAARSYHSFITQYSLVLFGRMHIASIIAILEAPVTLDDNPARFVTHECQIAISGVSHFPRPSEDASLFRKGLPRSQG